MAAADLLAQRSPAGRPRPGYASLVQSAATPGSPHTPLLSRSLSSQYGSPGSYRIEDEHVIYEFGDRYLKVGFAGENAPKAIWRFGAESSRRAGDYDGSSVIEDQGSDLELWHYDVTNLNLGLVEDKLERALRVIDVKHLMLDIKHRSASIVLPPCLPTPLVELALKAIFTGTNAPKSAYLLSHPVMAAVGAGLRSALVVDIGWHETNVTAVYEFREVLAKRSNRAGKRLAWTTSRVLKKKRSSGASYSCDLIDEVCTRFLWCRKRQEVEANISPDEHEVSLPLDSHASITVPISTLAIPTEMTFFDSRGDLKSADDHDLSLPHLVWKVLAGLPFDVRTTCISRVVVTGIASKTPGLVSRLLDELDRLVGDRSWDPVVDYGSTGSRALRTSIDRKKVERTPSPSVPEQDTTNPRTAMAPGQEVVEGRAAITQHDDAIDDRDEITEKLERQAAKSRSNHPSKSVRGIDTLGAWASASLMGHLKVEGKIEIKKEDFLKQGMNF